MNATTTIILALLMLITLNNCQSKSQPLPNIDAQIQTMLNDPTNNKTILAMRQLQHQYPYYPLISSALGYLYEQQKQNQAAEKAYQHAITLAPNNNTWLNNLGVFLCKQHRFHKAIKTLEKAKTLADQQTAILVQNNINKCSNIAHSLTPKTR